MYITGCYKEMPNVKMRQFPKAVDGKVMVSTDGFVVAKSPIKIYSHSLAGGGPYESFFIAFRYADQKSKSIFGGAIKQEQIDSPEIFAENLCILGRAFKLLGCSQSLLIDKPPDAEFMFSKIINPDFKVGITGLNDTTNHCSEIIRKKIQSTLGGLFFRNLKMDFGFELDSSPFQYASFNIEKGIIYSLPSSEFNPSDSDISLHPKFHIFDLLEAE